MDNTAENNRRLSAIFTKGIRGMLDLYTMGERIRQAREDMGYTRETFSEMANITPRFCYDIESRKEGRIH